jgi:hypothetical protein
MRLNNKISIKGDTLTIFKEGMFNPMKGGANLGAIAKKIYDELQLMGSYDSSDRQLLIKQAGLSGNDAATVSDMLFDMDADERYDDMSRYDEAIKQYLEEGEDEIDFDDENFSDPMIDDYDDMDRSNDAAYKKAFSSMNEAKMYYHVLEDGGYGRIGHQGVYNTKEEAQNRADKLSDMFPKSEFYVEAYTSKREPVTVTMESKVVNELSTFVNNSPVTSEYNGKTITWDDYEVTERNVDGGGYTNAIMLMGSDEDGNEYTCQGSTTHGDVDEWDDSTIEMVNSINEANTLPIIKSVTYFGGGNYTVILDDGYKILISGGNLEGIYGGDAEDVNSFVGQEWDQEPYNINEGKKAKTDPKDKKKADKNNYCQKDIADVDMVNPYELKKGIRIEMVDTEDYVKAMDKAVKKLKKDPMFYTNLIANSKQVKADKRSDLPKEVKDKKLNKTSDKMKDKANEMGVSKKDATKKNANDTLNKKEMAKGKPKGVKEMTMKPKSSKGMKAMDTPGKETKAKLKESISIFNSLKKLLLS